MWPKHGKSHGFGLFLGGVCFEARRLKASPEEGYTKLLVPGARALQHPNDVTKTLQKKTTGQWKPSCPLRPANTAGAIIGKSGTTLKQIRERWDSQLPSSGTVWGRRKLNRPTRFEGLELPMRSEKVLS